ncbi:hypothetical protein CLAIMM_09447 [Cladophialophora immunda]|nr:hypothetical protein CLAIMM_09447 [Cladophialophora immunda]
MHLRRGTMVFSKHCPSNFVASPLPRSHLWTLSVSSNIRATLISGNWSRALDPRKFLFPLAIEPMLQTRCVRTDPRQCSTCGNLGPPPLDCDVLRKTTLHLDRHFINLVQDEMSRR